MSAHGRSKALTPERDQREGRERLREVEQQYKRLQMEHDILKKAIAIFSDRSR